MQTCEKKYGSVDVVKMLRLYFVSAVTSTVVTKQLAVLSGPGFVNTGTGFFAVRGAVG